MYILKLTLLSLIIFFFFFFFKEVFCLQAVIWLLP